VGAFYIYIASFQRSHLHQFDLLLLATFGGGQQHLEEKRKNVIMSGTRQLSARQDNRMRFFEPNRLTTYFGLLSTGMILEPAKT
jgi:hypothetical protein